MPKTISIHSFRGGTGKSNTAANIATLLAAEGRRVGLVDMDTQAPGIYGLFGKAAEKNAHTLDDYLRGKCSVVEVAHSITLRSNSAGKGELLVVSTGDLTLVPSSTPAANDTPPQESSPIVADKAPSSAPAVKTAPEGSQIAADNVPPSVPAAQDTPPQESSPLVADKAPSIAPKDKAIPQTGYGMEQINQGFRKLIEAFKLDFLLIDVPAGLGQATLLSFAMSDVLAILMRTDQQDYQGTAVAIEVANKLGVPRVTLVVNKTPLGFETSEVKSLIEQTFCREVAAMLPYSEELVTLAGAEVFVLHYPDHLLTKMYRQLMERLIA